MNVLVTGGASGLGRAITSLLAERRDAVVFFTYHRSAASAHELESQFSNAKGVHCDLSDRDSLRGLLERVPSLDLDVLIHNAYAGFQPERFHAIEPEAFSRSFQENVVPIVELTRASIPIFKKKRFGRIISILTAAGINTPPRGWSVYTANKAYVAALCKSWATEYAGYNITSNCVSPSFMRTGMTGDFDERVIEAMEKEQPLKRLLRVEEVAATVSFLVDASPFLNGVNLVMNAGSDIVGL